MDYMAVLAALEEVARLAGAALMGIAGSEGGATPLGTGVGGDQTLTVDRLAEETILKSLSGEFDGYAVVSEEAGNVRGGSPILVIDPVDGSLNASRNIPFYAVSIALAERPSLDGVVLGVVHAPALNLTFTAVRGEGAFMNGRRITPSGHKFGRVIGLASPAAFHLEVGSTISRLLAKGYRVRVLGSASLGVCLAAAGSLDAYADPWGSLRPFDVAAAQLVAKEAGCHVDLSTDSLDPRSRLSIKVSRFRELVEELF